MGMLEVGFAAECGAGVDRAYASLAPPTGAHIASYPR